MRTLRSSWIASLLLASCASQPTAPETPAAHSGHSTAVAPSSAAAGPVQPHASGKPEIRYYVIGDA